MRKMDFYGVTSSGAFCAMQAPRQQQRTPALPAARREKELLELRMKHLLKKDPNAKGNGYMIRSLYFEDYFNSAYAEKESGVLMRKKYRIRIYDCSDRSIKLERKKKFGSFAI